MDNYCKEFQHIDPLQSYKPWVKNETIPNDKLIAANERQIAAVFVCSDPVDWSRDLQVRNIFIQAQLIHLVTLSFNLLSELLVNEICAVVAGIV